LRLRTIPAAADAESAAVISSGRNPVFAKQKLSPWPNRRSFVLLVLAASFQTLYPNGTRADSMEDAAKALARKVCATPRQSSLQVRWYPSSGAFSESLKRAFLAQLSACGIDTFKTSGSAALTATAQATASKVVLIADWGSSAETRKVVMVEIPLEAVPVSNESSLEPHLRRELLWQQGKPITSAVEWHDDSTKQDYLFLLSEGSFIRLRFENNIWTIADSTELPKQEHPSRGSWGVTFASQYPDRKLAVLRTPELCSFEPMGPPAFRCGKTNIGGKMAATVASPCDEATQFLVTDKGDYTQRDRVFFSGIEVSDPGLAESDVASRSVEVPGPVLDISNGDDPKTATAVVRNLTTGNYEVYRISAVCSY
jgi:hypothetical protein